MYSKGSKCYCLELNHFILFIDVTFFEFKPHLDTESHFSKSNEDFMHFLVQERSIDNNASLDITNLDALSPKHGEPTRVYTKCTSIVLPSSVVSVST